VPVSLSCDGARTAALSGAFQRATHSFAGEVKAITTTTTMSERPDHARIGAAKRPGFFPITYETHHPGDAFLGDAPIQRGPVHDSFTSVT
jgi:hypothetical protein